MVSFRADRHWHARFRTAPCSLDHSSCSSLRVARRSKKMRHAVRWRRQRRQGRCCRRWSCRRRARIPDHGRRGGQPVAPVLILRPRGSNCLHRSRNSEHRRASPERQLWPMPPRPLRPPRPPSISAVTDRNTFKLLNTVDCLLPLGVHVFHLHAL